MGVNFKALPWQPVGSPARVFSFRATGYLCTACVVALHQETTQILRIHEETGTKPEINRAQDGALSGIAGGIRWWIAAEDVAGTETDGQCCMMCGDDCKVHSVHDVDTHGHKTTLQISTTPARTPAQMGLE